MNQGKQNQNKYERNKNQLTNLDQTTINQIIIKNDTICQGSLFYCQIIINQITN